jgi:hypothetical protein
MIPLSCRIVPPAGFSCPGIEASGHTVLPAIKMMPLLYTGRGEKTIDPGNDAGREAIPT